MPSFPGIAMGMEGREPTGAESAAGDEGKYGLTLSFAARLGDTDADVILTGAVLDAGASIRDMAPSALFTARGEATRPPSA